MLVSLTIDKWIVCHENGLYHQEVNLFKSYLLLAPCLVDKQSNQLQGPEQLRLYYWVNTHHSVAHIITTKWQVDHWFGSYSYAISLLYVKLACHSC